ncbi:DUF4198 domain-containing protein [Stakelama saccharophila]|uniref:DUF4198 domain-containing protein n=1 Tax=Stakelama saccharophila TaxID=3075605 RepID=A0ABZ0B9U9_9SPHN|nr:DUF4198 domain-containing protein [Stakelama sp. W311]WNO54042.1 DUF4198 domain-containing protein [Stakelama sp. W311]
MTLKNLVSHAALILPAVALFATSADAHRRWLLPSATILSGDRETVSVDAAVANGLFYFEHHALGLDDLTVTGPDGKAVKPDIMGSGAYRSVFDVPLDKQGTYRIALASDGMFGSYMLNGERHRWHGSAAEAKTAIPDGASEVHLVPVTNRVETFATLGAPSDTALQPTGRGIEMVPVTHPNDLIAGEPAKLRFLEDGKPASGLEVQFIKGGTRYRDEAGVKRLTADADGVVTLSADDPGMYFLEAEDRPERGAGDTGADARRLYYSVVLEFMPA